jgi:TonB family protein
MAADQGNTRAQENLGGLYEKGLGVSQDYAEAMIWYRKAADQGNTNAHVNVGWLYQNGWGVKQDYSEAMRWYLGAANKGNAYAQTDIGWLYENGNGVTRDYSVAMAWYYRAASQGHAKAQNAIGWLYQNGWGVEQDYAKAADWYGKAAEQGNSDAMNKIGCLYEKGLGVHQDSGEAAEWYRRAVAKGNAHAPISLANHTLNPGATPPNGITPACTQGHPSSSCVTPPKVLLSPTPEYSKEASDAKYQGTCVLALTVGTDGVPRDIRVLSSLGMGLDEKAIEAVRKWKFEPGMKDGKPVAVQLAVQVDFHLK